MSELPPYTGKTSKAETPKASNQVAPVAANPIAVTATRDRTARPLV